jgi:hypothetical protein
MANAAANRHHGPAIYGHKGTITFSRGGVLVTPEALAPGSFDKREAPQPQLHEVSQDRGSHQAHTDNFFACMRSRKLTNLNAELGYQIMTAIRLGVDAYREGQAKLFDPKTQKVVARLAKRPEWEGDGKNHET